MQQHHQNATTRLEDAKHIEKTISELGQMFSKMASLVHAQAEVSIASNRLNGLSKYVSLNDNLLANGPMPFFSLLPRITCPGD